MRLSRIYIENFRNFHHFDVLLSSPIVIVGENQIGKSNLVHALRLVLDPSLPDTARQLRNEDFWDELPRPLTKEDRIIIAIELTDFEGNEDQLAVLGGYPVESDPMTARITYIFQPIPTLESDPVKEADYEFFLYGGENPSDRIGYEIRRHIPLDVLTALRDAEGDLAQWRRSPLRPLLDEAVSKIDRADIEAMASNVVAATNKIASIPEISLLAQQISKKLIDMVGSAQAVEMTLGFSPTDSERLIRALRLFIDGGKRSVGEASLGCTNILYLVLKSLELDQLVEQGARAHTFLVIEEPEAHLHPHLQRLTYRDFLQSREHHGRLDRSDASVGNVSEKTILLTTHSPHIVSVTPLRSLVLLRKSNSTHGTEGVSTANLELDDRDIADLERYLDVTRSELLFSRAVILVEGDAELYLIPVLAKALGVDFDELGISVCSVSGTNFTPYVKLLGPTGLNMPFAVLTDFDPNGRPISAGQQRILRLLQAIVKTEEIASLPPNDRLKLAQDKGLFLGDYTFEVDLFRSGRHKSMSRALYELTKTTTARARAKAWRDDPHSLDIAQFLADITAIGKGRFAQRLATRIQGNPCPSYVRGAIEYVATRCK